MNIIKRNGSEATFDINKIIIAVSKANQACEKKELSQGQINEIAEIVKSKPSAVKTRLHRARTHLKSILGDDWINE